MNILAVVGVGLIAAVLSIIIKQYKPEFGVYISLMAGILILAAVFLVLKPVMLKINELTSKVGISGVYGEVLLKALAICYITQLAVDTCKDAGEAAIGAKLEIAGKIAVIVISLPLFESIVSIIISLMS